jgi:hypothetical protein
LLAVGIIHVSAGGPLEEYWCAAHGFKCADRGVNAAGYVLLCLLEKFFRAGHRVILKVGYKCES